MINDGFLSLTKIIECGLIHNELFNPLKSGRIWIGITRGERSVTPGQGDAHSCTPEYNVEPLREGGVKSGIR